MRKKDIHVYYHVCLKNDGLIIALQQLHLLALSGLLYHSKSINIGIKYNNIDDKNNFVRIIQQYNTLNNINILYCEDNCANTNQELSTAIHFKNYADSLEDENNDFILYFHTKGVSHYGGIHENPTRHWRMYMEYFMIKNWRDCITKLNQGYESCGTFAWDILKMQQWLLSFSNQKTNLSLTPNTNRIFYPGTFYWLNTSLIKKIPIEYFYPNSEYLRWSIEMLPGIINHPFYAFSSPNPSDMNLVSIVIHPLQYIR